MHILGISAFYHDSAAALVSDGVVVAAAQEERFTRKKHDSAFPIHAIQYCLSQARLDLDRVDYIVFYEKPFLKFERIIETYLAVAPRGYASFVASIPLWIKDKLFLKRKLVKSLQQIQPLKSDVMAARLRFSEHHQSHAASAFFPSPFEDAAILTVDGVGEWNTTTLSHGRQNHIEFIKEINFPHSLGLLYSAFTYYTGFKVNSGEYKVMGLAPYGEPRYVDVIKTHLIDIRDDGSYRLDMSYFNYLTGLTMTSEKFHRLFGAPPRQAESQLTRREMDLACSIQQVTEEVMLKMARHARQVTGSRHLCLAGGVALNCVANGVILKEAVFDNLWIQPAAGDAGGALGAALALYYEVSGKPRSIPPVLDAMQGAYLGPAFEDAGIEAAFNRYGAVFHNLPDSAMYDTVVKALIEGKVVGWHHGRMEFGPRALGGRSIIGDARSEAMQSIMNLKIKYRESFRPFAPSVLRERVQDYFQMETDSPYMLLVAPVQDAIKTAMNEEQQSLFGIDKLNIKRSSIPAVTHIDYSARIQTVHHETNPRYHALMKAFEEKTGCGVLINTSFNVRGEPIVCTPADSYRCFMRTDMDLLVVENYVLFKEEQPPLANDSNWQEEFELD